MPHFALESSIFTAPESWRLLSLFLCFFSTTNNTASAAAADRAMETHAARGSPFLNTLSACILAAGTSSSSRSFRSWLARGTSPSPICWRGCCSSWPLSVPSPVPSAAVSAVSEAPPPLSSSAPVSLAVWAGRTAGAVPGRISVTVLVMVPGVPVSRTVMPLTA